MPADDEEALRDFMIVRDARNLEDYLTRFDITLSVMQTAEALGVRDGYLVGKRTPWYKQERREPAIGGTEYGSGHITPRYTGGGCRIGSTALGPC